MSVTFPILVLIRDSGEVVRFNSAREMQHHLERIDVENEEYLAWESTGRPVRMTVEEPLWLKLELRADAPDTQALFSALQKFAESRGVKLESSDRDKPPPVLFERIVAQSPPAQKGLLGRLFKPRRRSL